MNWTETTLGEVLPFRYGKNLPATKRSHSGEFDVVTSAGVVDSHSEPFVTQPSVVIGRKGTIGSLTYCAEPCWPTDTTFFTTGSAACDIQFGYYFLKTVPLGEMNNDSAVPGLNRGEAEALPVRIPELSEQKRISRLLGSLDDKIAANTRAINSSIALAESLVDRGSRSTRVRLGDVARITMGTSPKGEYLNEEVSGLPFYQGVRDFGDLTPQKRVFTENPVREAETGDILFAVRAPVGEVNIASEPTAIGRGLATIRGLSNHVALFYLLRSHPEIWKTHQDNGTVFASINKTDLSNALIPEIEMDQSQCELLAELHNQSLVLSSQNLILAKTRDELLPLLMSGMITVKEAEQEATSAGVDIAGEESEA